MDRYSRIRSIKLRRSGPGENFGFSARGGFEYGTGIFVSSVDPRSVAYKAKLRVGDQVLRVNGYPVTYALHSEFVALMRSRNVLQLKIRSVGMIPVRENVNDPLSWKLVEGNAVVETSNYEFPEDNDHTIRTSSQSPMAHSKRSLELDSWSNINYRDSRLAEIFVDTHGQSGLGCCICKGPPERPGIFVQSTKSNGIAKEAGLRPGDQILHCNGLSFIDIPFAEAAFHMKVSKKLNLIVIKGAAMDLFPGESSGYNSSASSSIGDHQGLSSRPSSDPNNHTSLEDPEESGSFRLQRLPVSVESRRNAPRRVVNSESDEDSTALDRHTEWIEVEETWKEAEKDKVMIHTRGEVHTRHPSLATTVISEMDEKIEDKRLQEERQKLIEEQRRLIEQAVKFEEEKRKFEEEKRQLERLRISKEENGNSATPKNSRSSSDEEPQKTLQSSLAGALHNEILKRVERREAHVPGEEAEEQAPKVGTVDERISLFASNGNLEKKQQHEQLIKEFKKVHQKMFAATSDEPDCQPEAKPSAITKKVFKEPEKQNFGILRTRKEVEHERKMVRHQVAGIVRQLQLKIERQQQETHETEREVVHSKGVFRREKSPPPPPPFPTMNEAALGKIASSMTNGKANNDGDSTAQEKCVIITVCGDGEQELGVPKSPSPDYSNSSSPIPFGEKEWERPGGDKLYNRKLGYQENGVKGRGGETRKKAPLPPGRRDYPTPGSGGNNSKGNTNSSCMSKSGVIDYDAGQISTSANGKVTIILREANHHGRMESSPARSLGSDKNVLPKGNSSKLSKGKFPEIVM